MSLAEKIRKSREKRIDVGGFEFVIRRPTELEMMQHARERDPIKLLRFVVGWGKVKEIDLIPGGGPNEVAFDAEACAEWLSDCGDLFAPVVEGIVKSYEAGQDEKEAAAKN